MLYTIIVFFLVLSVLVIIHELGHFTVAKLLGIRVEEFGFGIPPRIFGIRYKNTLYSLNLLPFGGFVRVFGEEEALLDNRTLTAQEKNESFAHKKPYQKALVLVAGVFLNFMLGWVIITFLFTRGVPVPTNTVRVQQISASSPASEAGLKKGDALITVIAPKSKPQTIVSTEDVAKLSQKYAGKEITFTIQRGSTTLTKKLTPRAKPPKGQGALGIVISTYEIKKYTLMQAPYYGLRESAHITLEIAKELGKSIFRLVTNQKQQGEIAGPIGIAQMTSQAARAGIDPLLQLVGLLSLNLAVLNILPFPSLDGGRLLFVIIEAMTRRRVPPKFEHTLNMIGFCLLIGLLLLVTVHDIIKLF